MIDLSTWTNENSLSLITILFAVLGGVFAYAQWRKSIRLRRSEFINQIIEKLRFDEDMVKAVYLIDYNDDWYHERFHDESQEEILIDKLFSYLTYICYLIETKNITKREFQIFDYELRSACECPSTQAYLWNLYWFSKSRNSICPFQYLIDYGITHNIISIEDFRKESGKYDQNLDF